LYAFCRYAAALVLVVYGFAKLNGSQFTVLSSELDKPMGDVSGFWLTWHYFGFSPIFGTLVAVVQIALGVLLCWRKTTLVAACGGLGVLATITLIDLWEIPKTAGIDPAPHQVTATWADFLRSQAEAILAMDFIETVTLTSARQYILAAIHHAGRRVRILGTTAHPHTPG
jgi:hypothetical protein